jgi:hypothetical protein
MGSETMTEIDNKVGFVFDKMTGIGLYMVRIPRSLEWDDHLSENEGVLIGNTTRNASHWIINDVDNPTHLLPNPDAPDTAPIFTEEQAAAKHRIDEITAIYRTRFISIGYGQEMTYLEKERQARAYLDDTNQAVSGFPMLAGEASIKGVSLENCATTIVSKADEWKEKAAVIEAARMSAKAMIDQADSIETVESIVENFTIEL